jgi:hypothetical protein
MGFKIVDGKGRGFASSVSDVNRLNVSSKSNPRIFYISRDDGQAFNMISTDPGTAAGEYIFYLKNTSSTRDLYVERIEFHSENAAVWKVWEVSGTAAGTTITASNLNLKSGKTADAIGFGNTAVTGLSTVKQIGTHRSQAQGEGEMNYHDSLILGPTNAIAVEMDAGSTAATEIDCFFHYEDINRGT